MKIKTNVRAGQGGASGVGQNSPDGTVDVSGSTSTGGSGGGGGGGGGKTVYYPPVSRCVGL